MVDVEEVRHVAWLARLELSDDDLERLDEELESVLGHFDRLGELEGEPGLPDRFVNVFREDGAEECLSKREALKNAPEAEEGFFVGPQAGGED
ncbi:MAG: Aspartyl/glutamyl-tRNA(Asn/Gln) amidotransferase subunit C [Methanonatronarchaeales archaeon]|nr:Aspartyl/glutamyl-tRNA(Asn/Gln) amidotransferase subunit C [Methanonatronarchaeales archaeon]